MCAVYISLCLQYISSVYWESRAEVAGSVSVAPSGVTVLRTVLMERMNLSAVRPTSQTQRQYPPEVNSMVAKWYCSLCFTVRLHGTNFILQSYSSDSEKWMPVCAENWDDNYGRAVCQQIGYQRCWLSSSLLFMSPFCRVLSFCRIKVNTYSQSLYCCLYLTGIQCFPQRKHLWSHVFFLSFFLPVSVPQAGLCVLRWSQCRFHGLEGIHEAEAWKWPRITFTVTARLQVTRSLCITG